MDQGKEGDLRCTQRAVPCWVQHTCRSGWPFPLQYLSPASVASWQSWFISCRQKRGHLPHWIYAPETSACTGLAWNLQHTAAFLHHQLEWCRGQNVRFGFPNEILRKFLDFKHSNPWSNAWTSEPLLAWDSEPLQKSQLCGQSFLGCVFRLYVSQFQIKWKGYEDITSVYKKTETNTCICESKCQHHWSRAELFMMKKG